MAEETRNLKLLTPIRGDGEDAAEIAELTFHEPDLDDIIAAEEESTSETVRAAFLLSRMAGVPFAVFRRLKARDAKASLDLNEDWLGN